MPRVGYACLNQTLRDGGVRRKFMNKKKWEEGGLPEVSRYAHHNLRVLASYLMWNEAHGLRMLRVTDLFPWMDQYEFDDLPDWGVLRSMMSTIGGEVLQGGHRLTVHPSQFCVLASPNGGAVQNTIRELVQAARIFDEMGLPRSPFAKINIHVGGVYGDKAGTLDRFCRVVETLPDSVRSRLTVENDDRPGGYTVPDLYESVYRRIGLPVVLDTLHHQLNPGVPLDEAVSMARSTWGDVTPIVHLASSRDGSRAHADWIIDSDLAMIPEGCDVMVEAKATEIAALDVLSRLSDQHSD